MQGAGSVGEGEITSGWVKGGCWMKEGCAKARSMDEGFMKVDAIFRHFKNSKIDWMIWEITKEQ